MYGSSEHIRRRRAMRTSPPMNLRPHSKPSSSRRKSRWDTADPKPIPPPAAPVRPEPPPAAPPPPSAYGFHNLVRRTILLADGTARTYFALPPDDLPSIPAYDLPPPSSSQLPPPDAYRRYDQGLDAAAAADILRKRKLEEDEIMQQRHRQRQLPEFNGFGGMTEPDGRIRRSADGVDYSRGAARNGGITDTDGRIRRSADGVDYSRGAARTGGITEPDGRIRRSVDGVDYSRGAARTGGITQPGDRIHRSADGVDYSRGAAPVSPRRRDDDEGRRSASKYQSDGHDHLHSRRGMSGDGHSRHLDVDPAALKEAFLSYSKLINESASQRRKYLEDRKFESLSCLVCDRMIKEFSSRSEKAKDYADCHSLIMHAYNSSVERIGHLGFFKALCVLMGWNYRRVPDDSKFYQSLSAEEQAASRADLIIWPPIVLIHNTILGKRSDGRVDGISNRDMDARIKDLGFEGGKSKSMYGKDGHMGITILKFPNSISGLTEAERLAEYFEKNQHGRKGWNHAEASKKSGENDEKNPLLVKVDDKTRIKKRILYGYLGTSVDLDKVDFDLRKKVVIKSRKELDISSDA